MSTPSASTCPSCGAPASGKFCSSCGAGIGKAACPKCGASVRSNARFCASCGFSLPAAGGTRTGADRLPWIVAGVAGVGLVVALIALFARKPAAAGAESGAPVASAPFANSSAGGAAPDISNMSPRERFDRLYNRIMQAAESGDQNTVTTFTPMAITAYSMLDTVDADARYHLALLKAHTGDMAGPTALADTILAQQPGHLFGYMIRGTVARWEKNDKALQQAYRDFLQHYDSEIKLGRPEYADHQRSVDEFHQQALSATKRS